MLEVYYSRTEGEDLKSEDFVRRLVRARYGLEDRELVIIRDEYGKPFFQDCPHLHFNISHTEGLMVCGLSDKILGLDVERLTPYRPALVNRYFSPDERAYVLKEEPGRDRRFTELWTLKEAWLKWRGTGIRTPLEFFNILEKKSLRQTWLGLFCLAVCSEELEGQAPFFLKNFEVRNQAQ